MKSEAKDCLVCQKKRAEECSHVDCPLRKRWTACEGDGFVQELIPSMTGREVTDPLTGDRHILTVHGNAMRRNTGTRRNDA